jgi:hypothetical protein
VIALLLQVALASADRPNRDLTPGVTRPISRTAVCSTRWGLDRRHVTEAMRRQVFAAYGIPYSQHRSYELDHLVPRELGGADDVANLWPQKWTGPYNARQKDRLENALHRAVCAGELSLHDAQESIRRDWLSSYRLWVRP